MSINDEFDEAEQFDSYEEPEPEVAQTDVEETASEEEVAAEDEQIEAETTDVPTAEVQSFEDVPSDSVESPEIEDLSAPASQVAESSPPPDEVMDRSPGVSEPPVPGEASVDIQEAPATDMESPEATEAPVVAESAEEVSPPESESSTDVEIQEATEDPQTAPEVEVPAVEESAVEQADAPEVDVESHEELVAPAVEESAADIPEVVEPEVERVPFDETPTPSASVEPLSAPPVIEDEAPSETLQEVVDEPVGFQGETNHPDVPETASTIEHGASGSDEIGDNDKAVFAQMQQAQQSADALARSLAANLDPMFEQMRTSQEFAVQEYMQRQLVETTIISRIK